MLAKEKIEAIATKVATANLTSSSVSSVVSESTMDSQGKDALRILIILDSNSAADIGGDAILDTLVEMQDRLSKAGEERFAVIEYATTKEVEDVADPQS